MQKLINMRMHRILIIANFLIGRSQKTRIGPNFSSWSIINDGVPQETKLGPLFVARSERHECFYDTVKFVDDTTLWEIVLKVKNLIPSYRLKLLNLPNGPLRMT